jgi:hypothetical protein
LEALTGGLEVADIDEAGLRRDPLTRERPAAGVARHVAVVALVIHPRRDDPRVLVGEVALLRLREGLLVPRVILVDRVPKWVVSDEGLLVFPTVEVRTPQEDPHRQVDLDEVGRDQFTVEDKARGDKSLASPVGHAVVAVVNVVGVVERAPADDVRVAVAHTLVAGEGLVEEVVEVVVHRHGALAVLDVAHEAHVVVGERLVGDVGATATWEDRRRVRVASAEEAVHLARVPGDLEGLEVEAPREWVERPHDVGDRLVAVDVPVRRRGRLGLGQDTGIRVLDHLLAEVDVAHTVVVDRVVEHVVGRLGEVERVVAELWRFDAVGHVLVQARAGAVVIAADAADATRDKVRVARVDPLHEDVEPTEDHRRAVALEDLPVGEVDLGVDTERPDDPGNRIPRHLLDDDPLLARCFLCGRHRVVSLTSAWCSRM